ncbi:MAG: thioredoxin family protein [Pseudomonadota bacterium]
MAAPTFMIMTFLLFLFLFCRSEVNASPDQLLEERYPGLAAGVLKTAALADLPPGVLLKTDRTEILEKELPSLLEKFAVKIRAQLQKDLFFLLEQEAVKRMLLAEAEAAGLTREGLKEEQALNLFLNQIADKAVVSDKDIREFYEANKNAAGGATLDEVKEGIREILLQQKKQAVVESYISNLGQSRNIKVSREWSEKQYALAMDNPVHKARKSGIPALVEFGASGCVPCDMMQPILKKLREKYGPRLNVLFVHVREEQVMGARYGIRIIPVQVFYDAQGREIFRHEGFFPEDQIIPVLKKMGIE